MGKKIKSRFFKKFQSLIQSKQPNFLDFFQEVLKVRKMQQNPNMNPNMMRVSC